MDLIRIATRESKLALWQAEFVKQELLRQYPSMQRTGENDNQR